MADEVITQIKGLKLTDEDAFARVLRAVCELDDVRDKNDLQPAVSPSTLPLALHPRFATCLAADSVVLVSADDVGFRVSLKLLTAMSTFFEDVCAADNPERIFPLPSATSDGLLIVLEMAKRAVNLELDDLFKLDEKNKHPQLFDIARLLREADKVIDVYQFERLPHNIADIIATRTGQPFEAFALSAFLNRREDASRYSTLCLDHPHTEMTSAVQDVLKASTGDYLGDLLRLYAEYSSAVQRMHRPILITAEPANGFSDFGSKCYKGDGCLGLRQFDEFNSMRKVAGIAVLQVLRTGYSATHQELYHQIFAVVGCHRCATRLRATFDRAILDEMLRHTWHI